jgi:hypothetical protein
VSSLEDLLSRTMLFTAESDLRGSPYRARRIDPKGGFEFAAPSMGAGPIEDQAIWHWRIDPAKPAMISELTALVRKSSQMPEMTMRVCDRIEATAVDVTLEPGAAPISLPLTPDFAVLKYISRSGHVPVAERGWWQLESRTDTSILVVFAYELPPFSGAAPKPLKLELIESLGSRFFPRPNVPADDPDGDPGAPYPSNDGGAPATASPGQIADALLGKTWVVVAFGLTTCKERSDFEPGGILGAGRIYPHLMVTCNRPLVASSATLEIVRPAKPTMSHGEMGDRIGSILVTDTNEARGISGGGQKPLPVWSNMFDYYDLAPEIGREFTVVDPKRATTRPVAGCIQRESPRVGDVGPLYQDSSTFLKRPGQGDYDNIHVAPRMIFENKDTGLRLPDIAMAPFCIHDCFHTHFRWGDPGFFKWGPLAGGGVPKWNRGFEGRHPYVRACGPLVPTNQTVTLKLSSPSSFVYRATAAAPITPATWTIFNHHGSSYALAITADTAFTLAQNGVAAIATGQNEPYTAKAVGPVRVVTDVDPTRSIAAFYHRLQFTGRARGHEWIPDSWEPRIHILDLDKCRRA